MNLLKTKASSGDRDYVRGEIASALRRKIVVIPVRVGREDQLPPLPRAKELPPEIRDHGKIPRQLLAVPKLGRSRMLVRNR